AGIQAGEPAADELLERGVRWVVLLNEVDSDTYASLRDDAGLALVSSSPSVDLFDVRGWPGHVVDDGSGEPVASSSPLRPWLRTPAHEPTLWPRPAQGGWLRGWTAADEG